MTGVSVEYGCVSVGKDFSKEENWWSDLTTEIFVLSPDITRALAASEVSGSIKFRPLTSTRRPKCARKSAPIIGCEIAPT